MTSAAPVRLKVQLDTDIENRRGDAAFQWPEDQRRCWIVAMFCGTLLLYAARSAVPLCMAAMSSDMNWDKEIDVGLVVLISSVFCAILLPVIKNICPTQVCINIA